MMLGELFYSFLSIHSRNSKMDALSGAKVYSEGTMKLGFQYAFSLILVCAVLIACGESRESDTALPAQETPVALPLPDLPIRLPEGTRLTDQSNLIPGTPSFYVQVRVPGGVDDAAAFFRAELARLGIKELEIPNPRQSHGLVVRLAGESQKARVVIMIVKHPIEKGSDADIRWEEPPL